MNVRVTPDKTVHVGDLAQDKSMHKLLLGFVGLKRAHEAGIGEQEAMKLFNTLAKTHRAGRDEMDIRSSNLKAHVPNSL